MRSSWLWYSTVNLVLLSAIPVVQSSMEIFRKNDDVGQGRIVGGDEVPASDYPFYVRLTIFGKLSCGGSLIHPEWVLSAAHCQNTDLLAFVGADNDSDGIRIAESFVHPGYSNFMNDYMLLRLSQPVRSVNPILLNTNATNPCPGDDVVAVGMGVTEPGSNLPSSTLRKVTVQAISHEKCQNLYNGLGWTITDSTMLCAGTVTGKDTCSGDSGGPLLDKSGVLVGLTSFGYGCADPNYPGVYARISAMETWGKNVMCAHSTVEREGLCPTERRQRPHLTEFGFVMSNPRNNVDCTDSSERTFYVNDEWGFQTCQWLASAPQYKHDLCVDGSDASKYCMLTCKSCP